MKNELIQLAKEKKFSYNIISEEPWKYSVNEELRWLFWMTSLQKWLREVHNIHINLDYGCGVIVGNEYYQYSYSLEDINRANEEERFEQFAGEVYPTYEASLEAGLYNALQLIK